MKQALIYSLKVWLTTGFVSPLLIIAYQGIKFELDKYLVLYILGHIFWGLTLSIPCLVIIFIAVWALKKQSLSIATIKSIICLIGVLSIVGLVIILLGDLFQNKTIAITYLTVTLAGIWLYKT